MPPELDQSSGAAQWVALSDALLAGLVHMLNNRITALSVCAELAAMGDDEMIAGGVLTTELKRLQGASALIGLMPSRPHQPEALELRPVLDDALALHAHHPKTRLVECEVRVDGAMQPVRAPRWALLRLLLVLVDAAKEAADASGSRAVLHLASDEHAVRLRLGTPGDGGPYAAEMAALCGGRLAREGGELKLTLPSLLEPTMAALAGPPVLRPVSASATPPADAGQAQANSGMRAARSCASARARTCDTRDSLTPSSSPISRERRSSK